MGSAQSLNDLDIVRFVGTRKVTDRVFGSRRGKYHNKQVRLVDGEKVFNQPGRSCGFWHFQDLETGKCAGFGGVLWCEKNLRKV